MMSFDISSPQGEQTLSIDAYAGQIRLPPVPQELAEISDVNSFCITQDSISNRRTLIGRELLSWHDAQLLTLSLSRTPRFGYSLGMNFVCQKARSSMASRRSGLDQLCSIAMVMVLVSDLDSVGRLPIQPSSHLVNILQHILQPFISLKHLIQSEQLQSC